MITAKYECLYCEIEFLLIDNPAQIVEYCPYCGSNDIKNIEEPNDDYTKKF